MMPNNLRRLAESHGIMTSYLDATGQEQQASEQSIRKLLEVFGVPTGEEESALKELRAARARRMIEPVIVSWEGRKTRISASVPSRSRIRLRLELEDGTTRTLEVRESRRTERVPQDGAARRLITTELRELPSGYHKLIVEAGNERAEALLISAPECVCEDPAAPREWGLFAPLYAVHSAQSWGAGNFTDWTQFTEIAAAEGARVVSSLPVLAAFLGKNPCDPSPYSPASRLFWNEFFVDVAALPEFQRSRRARKKAASPAFQARLTAFRGSPLIDYPAQMQARREILEILSEEFFSGQHPSRRPEFDAFCKRRPRLEDYARFRAATEQAGTSWHSWKPAARAGKITGRDFAPAVRDCHLFAQWAAQQQMDGVLQSARSRGVKFYLDLPLGVNPDSYDAWRCRDFFAQGVSAGAPPDPFFTKGQDWGFAPLHPEKIRELHYRYVIDYLRFQMKHTGMLRLDHVMALHRLYWVPHGSEASEGAYVKYRADELYAILSLESHRHQCVLVGENLGTVPPEVNQALERHGVRRMFVVQLEPLAEGRLPQPREGSVASLNTHDMPTFAAHWQGLDIADRLDLGLLGEKSAAAERKARARWRKEVLSSLRKEKLLGPGEQEPLEVFRALMVFLGRSAAPTVLASVEDFWGEEGPQNVPGTSSERPNWRRKARLRLDEMRAAKGFREAAAALRAARAAAFG